MLHPAALLLAVALPVAQPCHSRQELPDPPSLVRVECNMKVARVFWQPPASSLPILSYRVQYKTAFSPDTWQTARDPAPATATSFKVPLSPWTRYTFRVLAISQGLAGDARPSGQSEVCLTPEDVPHRNPDNVSGQGTAPGNLVISWTVSVHLSSLSVLLSSLSVPLSNFSVLLSSFRVLLNNFIVLLSNFNVLLSNVIVLLSIIKFIMALSNFLVLIGVPLSSLKA